MVGMGMSKEVLLSLLGPTIAKKRELRELAMTPEEKHVLAWQVGQFERLLSLLSGHPYDDAPEYSGEYMNIVVLEGYERVEPQVRERPKLWERSGRTHVWVTVECALEEQNQVVSREVAALLESCCMEVRAPGTADRGDGAGYVEAVRRLSGFRAVVEVVRGA